MEKKYSLTNESKIVNKRIVYRIIAEKDFYNIKKGTLGGFVESEYNLSHEGNCWIHNDAIVCDNAKVYGNAKIYDNVMVYDHAEVCGSAQVCDYTQVCGHAIICNKAFVHGSAKVYDSAIVYENAKVYDNAEVYGNTRIRGYAQVYDDAQIYGHARVCGDAKVCGYARVCDKASISEKMLIKDTNVYCSLENNILENIRCQTGLGVFNNKVIAYKQVNKDMTSFYDENFKYEVGKVIEVENADISNRSCASGLHFSNMNYWNLAEGGNTGYLMAEIDINDIITVQQGKIRCKRAKILGTYNI